MLLELDGRITSEAMLRVMVTYNLSASRTTCVRRRLCMQLCCHIPAVAPGYRRALRGVMARGAGVLVRRRATQRPYDQKKVEEEV